MGKDLTNLDRVNIDYSDLFHDVDDSKEDAIISKIEAVGNIFETGSEQGDYDEVVVYPDGKGGTRQVTYGKSQTTEQGNLPILIEMYIAADGKYAEALKPGLDKMKAGISVANDSVFKITLQEAGKDPIMHDVQDEFFKLYYLKPALNWFFEHGFTQPLSLLVIYDSFIHSGGILNFLRKKFSAVPPSVGGNEKGWISSYVTVRRAWLLKNSNKILQKTVYRMDTFLDAIMKGNWNLEQKINAHGRII